MFSCDTFALTGPYYQGGRNLLAKNSDRPLGEAQPLRYFPASDHAPGTTVQCTHLTVPQVSHTYAMLGCQPYWIWGFEMGVNEKGLAIGNEAEFSRCPAESEEGLLGMDILRLALERAANAREAIEVITSLLERYGQNANANPFRDRRYENSFLLCDPEEIWLLETAGRKWAARQVTDWAAISNCYSIGTQFDLCSKDLESYARQQRWLGAKEPFDFSKAYTNPSLPVHGGTQRWRRAQKRISSASGPLDEAYIKSILRDHYEEELISPRFGAFFGSFVSICMHAQTIDGSQTAASLVVSRHEKLGIVARYAPSVPCCSVYIPVYMTGVLPRAMEQGQGHFEEDSLWWTAERLSAAVSADEARFGPEVRKQLRELEERIVCRTAEAEAQACGLVERGLEKDAATVLNGLTQWATDQVMELSRSLYGQIRDTVICEGGLYGQRMEVLSAYNKRAELKLFE